MIFNIFIVQNLLQCSTSNVLKLFFVFWVHIASDSISRIKTPFKTWMCGIIFAHVEGNQVHLRVDGERKHRCLGLCFACALESYQWLLLIDLETDYAFMKSRVRGLELHNASSVLYHAVQSSIYFCVLCCVLEIIAAKA